MNSPQVGTQIWWVERSDGEPMGDYGGFMVGSLAEAVDIIRDEQDQYENLKDRGHDVSGLATGLTIVTSRIVAVETIDITGQPDHHDLEGHA